MNRRGVWMGVLIATAVPVHAAMADEPEGAVGRCADAVKAVLQANPSQTEQVLEELKVRDPATYERVHQALTLQQRMEAIIDQFRNGGISEETARAQLVPLVMEQLDGELATLDAAIAETRTRLETLERQRQDPEGTIASRIDRLLGN